MMNCWWKWMRLEESAYLARARRSWNDERLVEDFILINVVIREVLLRVIVDITWLFKHHSRQEVVENLSQFRMFRNVLLVIALDFPFHIVEIRSQFRVKSLAVHFYFLLFLECKGIFSNVTIVECFLVKCVSFDGYVYELGKSIVRERMCVWESKKPNEWYFFRNLSD